MTDTNDSTTLKANAEAPEILNFLNETQHSLPEDMNKALGEFVQEFSYLERQDPVALFAQNAMAAVMANFIKWIADNASANEAQRRRIVKSLAGRQIRMLSTMLDEGRIEVVETQIIQ